MKTHNNSKVIGLSLVLLLGLSTVIEAGKIGVLTNQASPPSYSSGYGGWNLDNVNVKMTDLDFNDLVPPKTFTPSTGSYDTMVVGDTFESEIYETNTSNTVVLGHLHGKNWPVGEPAGIKVIEKTFDATISDSKPANCIMTTSYLEGSYLDAATPSQTLCSSDFQTHKRFKINMLPAMVAVQDGDRYGKGVDLTFNVEHDTNTWRYNILQKINNYTGKRLDGFKVEVGFIGADGNFTTASDAGADIRLSLGIGENIVDNVPGDIWDFDQMANFSHGLFGDIDKHFLTNGFFDDKSAGYNVVRNDANDTISSTTAFAGSNYNSLPVPYATADYNASATQFGNWLPSIWAPKGIFYDEDNDPATDNDLVAFWGDRGDGNYTWMKGDRDNFVEVSALDLAPWSINPLYSIGNIEDVLNLGLNYIVEIGDDTSFPVPRFTIRITPRVAVGQTAPGYMTNPNTTLSSYLSRTGTVSVSPAPTFAMGSALTIVVADSDLNASATVNVIVTTSLGESETITLNEIGIGRGVFTGTLATEMGTVAGADDNNITTVAAGTVVTVTYLDASNENNVTNTEVIATTTATVTPIASSSSSDSGPLAIFSTMDDVSLLLMILGFLSIGGFIVRKRLRRQ